MPRRRRHLDRPHEHLVAAAAVHAAVDAGELPGDDDAETTETEREPTPSERTARAQHRDQEGKFA